MVLERGRPDWPHKLRALIRLLARPGGHPQRRRPPGGGGQGQGPPGDQVPTPAPALPAQRTPDVSHLREVH